MEIIRVNNENADKVAELVANFRVELKKLKGIDSLPDAAAGKMDIEEYIAAGYPVYAAIENNEYIAYLVCRVEAPTVWMESIFVKASYRGTGVADALLSKAEEIAASYGRNVVYNFVHPNNNRLIAFLKKHGYTVLNLVKIRKTYPGEQTSQKIRVGNNEFDY